MEIVVKILQFLLSFSLLVLVHEFGHFIFARIFGVRVDRFKIFFGKSIFSFKKGDTEWAIGWIPFGGYCKLNGMIDESMDTDFISSEPQPYEFRSKKPWQRVLMMGGGVLMNLILAFLVYVGISMAWGDKYLSTRDVEYGYLFSSQAKEIGFRDGDRIISVNGKHIEDVDKLAVALMLKQNGEVVVDRAGEIVRIDIPARSVVKTMEAEEAFIWPRYPFVATTVFEGTGAAEGGMLPGDRLVALNGEPQVLFDEYVGDFRNLRGQQVEITVRRDSAGVAVTRDLLVNISDEGTIGVETNMFSALPLQVRTYNFFQAFPAGFRRVGSEISGYWDQLKLLVNPKTEAYKTVSGPIGIGNIFPGKWDWYRFWNITGLLSIVLAIMNLLPIPGLDGGHIVFTLYEMITRRKPGDKFMLYAQVVGMAFILFLMVYATWNDISRIFFKG